MKNLLIITAIAATALLSGCANDDLNAKVDKLSAQVSSLQTSVDAAAADAARANARLDNVAGSYKK